MLVLTLFSKSTSTRPPKALQTPYGGISVENLAQSRPLIFFIWQPARCFVSSGAPSPNPTHGRGGGASGGCRRDAYDNPPVQGITTRRKVSIYHDWHFRSLLKTPFYHDFGPFRGRLKNFFLIFDALYCHRLGQIMVDGRPARGRCWFFDFASDFGLWPTFSGCGAVMSVSLADLFFLFLRPSSRCSMQQYMVWTVGLRCQPLRLIICSTRLLATCFYFSKPLALIMFMDTTVWWDLNVHLSEQETSAMFRMFMDAWYVANVSIIFDASCLFYTNYFVFCLHFVAFLCIFWN
jgi:hypothetical protein